MTKRSVTKKPKLTKWFDGGKFVPYHVGIYQIDLSKSFEFLRPVYSYWSGENWSYFSMNFDLVSEEIISESRARFSDACFTFRGLAQNPEVQP